MADAFRERLLNVLSTLRPQPLSTANPNVVPAAVPTPPVVPVSTVTSYWPAHPPALVPSPPRTPVPWALLWMATFLASVGLGMAVATLIWKHRSRSGS